LYRAWEGRLSVTMRQSHAAGDKLFGDYAGDGVPVVIDRRTGERRAAQIFVAVLGASSFTYAQATWSQGLADWISGHVGAFEAIGGVPALLVPDNTKVAVIKACLYDPQINRSYADMAAYYGTKRRGPANAMSGVGRGDQELRWHAPDAGARGPGEPVVDQQRLGAGFPCGALRGETRRPGSDNCDVATQIGHQSPLRLHSGLISKR
jgi:hypothetical protein